MFNIVQFADEKTSWKILQQARQQQEELQEELGLRRYLKHIIFVCSICKCFYWPIFQTTAWTQSSYLIDSIWS